MVGQHDIKNTIKAWKEDYRIPRFLAITGPPKSGKRMLARYISKQIHPDCVIIPMTGKVDSVREAVEISYNSDIPIVFLFAHAHEMSSAAINALLKVTEEPPRQAYFIITLPHMDNTLATIRSRATEIKMQTYSEKQVQEYCIEKGIDLQGIDMVTSPGMAEYLSEFDAQDMLSYADMIVDNIAHVPLYNALKISNQLKTKEPYESGDKPAHIMLDMVSDILASRVVAAQGTRFFGHHYVTNMTEALLHTRNAQNKLLRPSFNKGAVMDEWIVDIRRPLQNIS